MLEDIAYNDEFRTSYDEVGDIQTVEGEDAIVQAINTSVVEFVGLSSPPLNATELEERRSDIESVVEDNSFTQDPVTVTIDDIDEEEQAVRFRIETGRVSLTVEQT